MNKGFRSIPYRTALAQIVIYIVIISSCFVFFSYYITRNELNEQVNESRSTLILALKEALQLADTSAQHNEQTMDKYLYSVALTLQQQLTAQRIKSLTRSQLVLLANQYDISDITITRAKGAVFRNSISSDPLEIGYETIEGDKWNDVMQQLATAKEKSAQLGFMSPTFWSGPFAQAKNYDQRFKTAILYSPSLNVYVQLAISEKRYQLFYDSTSPNLLISRLVNSNADLDEITIINNQYFFVERNLAENRPSVAYGTYYRKMKFDAMHLRRVIQSHKPTNVSFTMNGRDFVKSYVRLDADHTMMVSYDISEKNEAQQRIFLYYSGLFIVSLLGFALLLVFLRNRAQTLLAIEMKRLAVAEDFRNVVDQLPNVVYRIIRRNGNYYFTFVEGKTAAEFHLQTELVKDQPLQTLFLPKTFATMALHIERAFNGEAHEFLLELNGTVFKNYIRPFNEDCEEVVGYTFDVTEIVRTKEKIQFIAYHDSLTKLANRLKLKEDMIRLLAEERPFTIMLLDMDNFKHVNDKLGHAAGDQLLIDFSEQVTSLNLAGKLYRLGGDEFVYLIEDGHVTNITNEILALFTEPTTIKNETFYLSLSIGVASYPRDALDESTLLKYADIAMYEAKHLGKNQAVTFNCRLKADIERQLDWKKQLAHAVETKQLHFLYKPYFDTRKQKLLALESVMMVQLDGELLEASELIEEYGNATITAKLNQLHLDHLQQLAYELIERHYQLPLTMKWLAFKGYQWQKMTIHHSPLPIILQVDESLIAEREIEGMKEWAKMHISFSFADFGTSILSLQRLHSVPLYYVKIHPSFVDQLIQVHESQSFLRPLQDYTKRLGIEIIVPNVSSEEQLRMLQAAGCYVFEGPLFTAMLTKERLWRFLLETT